jgi:carbamoyltransferase
MNSVKGREPFRPFAPVIRAELVHDLFDLPVTESPYMQFIAWCKKANEYPAIVHHDGTSRVQTVTPDNRPGLYELLKLWEARTGCHILLNTSLNSLNTSLNSRGEPLVNDREHANSFAQRTGISVL